ncbi:MAG TPA: RNA polymerase sigma factor [Blastocatellia bacterium]|nr:RNA polymerase sigma factor [Blastocatellia bacterium]
MDKTTDNFALATVKSDDRPVDNESDEELALLAGKGDERAFERIFYRHRKRVARLAGRFFNRPERIEEIVQETFTKMYVAVGSYSAERGQSFAAWLTRIAINSCYDELRRTRRRPEGALDDVTADEMAWLAADGGRASAANNSESAVILRDLAAKLLARLAPDDRLVLTLLDGEEMSVVEIARAMGWSDSKVKVRAHRARQSLRRVLAEYI